MLPLAKFLETQHPRDGGGRFTDAAQRPVAIGRMAPFVALHARSKALVDDTAAQRRTQHKMPSYYRMAGRVRRGAAAPADAELPVGSFKRVSFDFHKPKSVSEADHTELKAGLTRIIGREREAVVARAMEPERGEPLIPEGTPKREINRAYTHAAMIALHKFGVGHYDFRMDDELKADWAPLEPFMRYAQRRVLDTMLSEHKGAWKPYREEFGEPFRDRRTDAEGNVRLRVKPLQVLIKAAPFGILCKGTFDETKHKRGEGGQFAHSAQLAGGAIGTAVAAAGVGAALRKPIQRGAALVGRRKGAAVRLAARRNGAGFVAQHLPDVESVVRDQSRLAAHMAGSGWARRMSLGASLGAGILGNYAGDFIGRRLGGAKGEGDSYDTSMAGLALGAAGLVAGHKLGGSRLLRFGKLAKFDESKHPRSKGRFASKGEGADDHDLVQPAQILGGFALGAGAVHAASKPTNRLAARAGKAAENGARKSFLANAVKARAVTSNTSAQLLQHQAHGFGRLAGAGARFGVRAGAGLAAATIGDIAGDWAARKLTGKKGKEDEYRHLSIGGLVGGTAGMMVGEHQGSSRLWRSLRNRPVRRGVMGVGLGILGGIAGEVAGNLLDEKTHTTDLLAGTDRKTVLRFATTHGKA